MNHASVSLEQDWLIAKADENPFTASIETNEREIVLSNGLIRRKWRLVPNCTTVGFDNLLTKETIIRSVNQEAIVTLNGQSYDVGGVEWNGEKAYLKEEWLDLMEENTESFKYKSHQVHPLKERFSWKRKRGVSESPWPPKGISLTFYYDPPEKSSLEGVSIAITYDIYDGIPLLSKQLTIFNHHQRDIVLDHFVGEILSTVEVEAPVDDQTFWDVPNIHVESDFAFHGMTSKAANETTHWLPDPSYTTQVNFNLNTLTRLESKPKIGPAVTIAPGESFASFRTFELVFDSTDRERKSLTQKKMYRLIAPWVTENPLIMHVLSDQTDVVKQAIDQAEETGFEMVMLSFGSGFNMENDDEAYLLRMKELADYAHTKGIELGGYSLLASRSIGPEHDVISDQITFNQSPCLASAWGLRYFDKLKSFFEKTGFDALEHDGSYPGDICESRSHPGHQGKEDSQWIQWKMISEFYIGAEDEAFI
ncbi:hypothetical protein G4V62_16795 [Bacillaceae bacterium SIJ1]|uniref:hypothetical protein n=1 Tax=Litoribacterium kuwaitense TaxID=1398745 RepID=UPI0013EDC93F|nr:hypothetical protein [Litoribacterium kuwaitense]NGP46523.1 hypothetical protein [Litoribacterium kuwaitense]